jgi:hypothetical protein
MQAALILLRILSFLLSAHTLTTACWQQLVIVWADNRVVCCSPTEGCQVVTAHQGDLSAAEALNGFVFVTDWLHCSATL